MEDIVLDVVSRVWSGLKFLLQLLYSAVMMLSGGVLSGLKGGPSMASREVLHTESPHIARRSQSSISHHNIKSDCDKCGPSQSISDSNITDGSSALVNILRLPSKWTIPRLRGIKGWLEDVRYTLGRKTHIYPDVSAAVLTSKRVAESIEHSLEGVDGPERVRLAESLSSKAKQYMEGMSASISHLVIRMTAYVLLKVLRRFLSGILVAEDQIEQLRAYQKECPKSKRPIIYLPLHRSHLDYILLTYILWHHDLRVPHVASGDNLNFSCFGWLLRGLGAFFIRRRLDKGAPAGERDYVYRAVLHSYMQQLLQAGEPIEFFMEGTRSRLGKTLMPKAGLMSIIVDSLLQGDIEDALIVPVSYSYERVLDQGFVEELLGKERARESLMGVWGSIWKALGEKYGTVRVDFGHPTSLKSLTASMNSLQETGDLELIVWPGNGLSTHSSFSSTSESDKGSCTAAVLRSSALLVKTESTAEEEAQASQRRLVHAAAHHILYQATANAAVTGSQLVACLLAAKYQQGAWLRELVIDFAWLSGEVRLRGAELLGGFGGVEDDPESAYVSHGLAGCDERRAMEAVQEAIAFLGPEILLAESYEPDYLRNSPSNGWLEKLETDSGISSLATDSDDDPGCRVFVRPLDTPLANCLLSYYKNGAMHVFALDSLLATSFLSLNKTGPVELNQLLERAERLGCLLADQFYFTKPCEKLRSVLERRLNNRFLSPRVRVLQRLSRFRASTSYARRSPDASPQPLLPTALEPIWELGDGNEEEEDSLPVTDSVTDKEEEYLQLSEFDECYSVRVLRFYAGLLLPFLQKLSKSEEEDWLREIQSEKA